MEFLHDGAPEMQLHGPLGAADVSEPAAARPTPGQTLVDLVGRLNLASGEGKARHYDHEVKGLTVVKPWIGVNADVPAEATVFLARHGSLRGYVLSEGINPFFSDIDPGRHGRNGRRGGPPAALRRRPARSHRRPRQLLLARPGALESRRPMASTSWRSWCVPAAGSTTPAAPTACR